MKIENILKNRRSVREYKDKKIEKSIIDDLFTDMAKTRRLVNNIDFEFHYIDNGEEVFSKLDGMVGYHGKIIKAPQYVALVSEEKEGYLENSGYLGERLVLKATEKGLGTCWIEVPEEESKIKDILNIKSDKILVGLLAFGYPKNEGKVNMTSKGGLSPLTEFGYPNMELEYYKEPVSSRVSIEDLVYLHRWGNKANTEELENRGIAEPFYFMRLAPSWGNRQPWKFILDGDRIVLAVRNDSTSINEKVAKIEAGIAMLYLELMMHQKGIPGGWRLEGIQKDYGIPENYIISGYYTI